MQAGSEDGDEEERVPPIGDGHRGGGPVEQKLEVEKKVTLISVRALKKD